MNFTSLQKTHTDSMHYFNPIFSAWEESHPPQFRLLFHYLTKKVSYSVQKFSISRILFFFMNFENLKEKKKKKKIVELVNTKSCDTN